MSAAMSFDGVYSMSTFLDKGARPVMISCSTAMEIRRVRCKYRIVGSRPVLMTLIIALLSS
eukprot:8754159-Lingulodinium_polyedra.AAC.1